VTRVKKILLLVLAGVAAVVARKRLMETKAERSAWGSATDRV